MLAGGAQPEAQRGLVDQYIAQRHQNPADVHQQRVAAEQVAQDRNVLNQRNVDLGKSEDGQRVGAGVRARHAEDGAQQEHRKSSGEDVQRHADDVLVGLELHHEQAEERAQQQAHRQRQHESAQPAAQIAAAQHRKERAAEHHAVHADVHDAHVVGHQHAQRRQHHGGRRAQGVLEQSDGEYAQKLTHVRCLPSQSLP